MKTITRKIRILAVTLTLIAVAVGALVATHPALVAFGDTNPPGSGVTLKITSVSIPADRKPVVSFDLTDAKGAAIRVSDLDTNGIRFMIAAIKTDPETQNTFYSNYIFRTVKGANFQFNGETKTPALATAEQATTDTGGVLNELGSGKVTYTFAAALPADFNVGETHAVGSTATRANRASVSNDVFYFVPSGAPATVTREVVTTANCNTCHDALAVHGGTRRDTRLCVLCHTTQSVEPNSGNNVDFKQLVHKIHTGANLPSVKTGTPYFIGGSNHDFSNIVWPQDTRNCQTCHAGAPQGDNFKAKPSAEACGSCHDSVDFKTGKNHGGGVQLNNAACASCHTADGPEFGLSVKGAHTIPEKSTQLRGVNFEIVSFTNTKPGQNPTVEFNIKDKAGTSIKPSEMANLAFVLSGPTTDYASPAATEVAITRSVATGDNFSYTFQAKIPDDAKGTYAVGVQGYLSEQLKTSSGTTYAKDDGTTAIRDAGFNKIAYGAVTDKVPQPRKQVVDVKNCNVCHETLAFHGGSRRDTQFCVMCHNPQNSDADRRAVANGPLPAESLTFNNLIHRIHTGEDQAEPFILYGGRAIDLSEARYPTDRRNCTKCHLPNSNLLSFARPGIQATTIKLAGKIVSQTGAIQTICTSCHDGAAAKAHADTMTAGVPTREACTVCHNEGRDFAVSKVHAQ